MTLRHTKAVRSLVMKRPFFVRGTDAIPFSGTLFDRASSPHPMSCSGSRLLRRNRTRKRAFCFRHCSSQHPIRSLSQSRGPGLARWIERLHEEFKRRIKTQRVLPSAESAAMLFWALLASGQITMRKVDGWQSLTQKLADKPIDLAT
jgi:hypothetical protein